MYHYTDGGLVNVWLVNGYEVRQTPFGEGLVIHDLDGLTRAICLTLAEKPDSLTGVELRYIRSAGMLLSQPALGKLIGVDGQTVARWEKSGRVLDVHHHGHVQARHQSLHPAHQARMLHVRLGRQCQPPEAQHVHHHRVVDVAFLHPLPSVLRQDDVRRTGGTRPDVLLKLALRWYGQDDALSS